MKTYLNITVKQGDHYEYICLSSIPEPDRERFLKWMGYNTGLNKQYGCPDFVGVFRIDFERWYEKNIL